MRADSYDPNRISAVVEYQCRPHGGDYSMRGLSVPMRVWEGNALVTTTTHFKPSYLRRNGMPRSAKATLTEHWIRPFSPSRWRAVPTGSWSRTPG